MKYEWGVIAIISGYFHYQLSPQGKFMTNGKSIIFPPLATWALKARLARIFGSFSARVYIKFKTGTGEQRCINGVFVEYKLQCVSTILHVYECNTTAV